MPTIQDILKEPDAFRHCVEQGLSYKPLGIKFKIINHCNLRCQMCNHWRRNEKYLNAEFFFPAIKDLVEIGCQRIHFSGGEPLLYPDLFPLMKYIRHCSNDIKISMTSNGTLIDDYMAKSLAEFGLSKANISIDSPEGSVHDMIRSVPGTFDKACSGFQNLRKYMPTKPLYINVVVSPWNYRTLPGFPKLAHELGASSIHFLTLGVHTEETSPFTSAQIEEYNTDILPTIIKEAKKYGIPMEPPRLDVSRDEEVRDYNKHHKCYALFTHLLINYHGMVYPCCRMMEMPMGNLHHNSIKEIWYGKNYERIRKKKTLPMDPKCQDCDMFYEDNLLIDKYCFGKQ